jgi:glycosyltransferase involved in cell wall biosynthesis
LTGPEISVLIPARNEAGTIGIVIDRAIDVLAGGGEIVVVDDGSVDATQDVVRQRSAVHPEVRLLRRELSGGKGTAVRAGLHLCTGSYVILQDADFELDPRAYPALMEPLRAGRAAFVNGSRFMLDSSAAPRRTVFANRVLTAIANMAYGTRLTDLCSGHKAFDAAILRSLPIRSSHYELESELVGLIARRGLRMEEVPTAYRPRTRREGKRIGLRDGLLVLRTILATRFRST